MSFEWLEKLPAKYILILIIVLFLVITILALAGVQIPLPWGVISKNSSDSAPCLLASDISDILGEPIDSNSSKEDLKARLKQKVNGLQAELNDWHNLKNNFFVKVSLIELEIPKYGTNIPMDGSAEVSEGLYKNIQLVLKVVGFYPDEPDGDQQRTEEAVIKFQEAYNREVKRDEQISPLGVLGYGTTSAFRTAYKYPLKSN